MQALEKRMEKQRMVEKATERAFLAQAALSSARAEFAAALQELDQLGEDRGWIRDSFDLSSTELKHLLALHTSDWDSAQNESAIGNG